MWMRILDRFVADRRGSVAMTFGLVFVVMVGAIGAAIDYSQAARLQRQLQEALDAAAVAAAKSVGRPEAEIIGVARSFLAANLPPALASTAVTIEVADGGATVRLRTSEPARLPTTLLGVVGISSIPVSVSAEARNGIRDLEVVLALDNTGSMSGQKINVLRRAVVDFLRAMEDLSGRSGRQDSVRVGIVPFDTNVNMGHLARNRPWVDFSQRGRGSNGWDGCVTDREQSHDVAATAPAVAAADTWFVATDCSLADVALLSSNWGQLQSTASRMQAAGMTNVTIGLAHAHQLLTPGEPYNQAQAPRERLSKVVVLLTDGENTQNRWTRNASQIDQRTQLACENIKRAGIAIYTIRVMEGDENLLRGCASAPSMYFNVTAPEQIATVFNALANQLTALRLSR
jgi:Flp pilus assembly protein TadG